MSAAAMRIIIQAYNELSPSSKPWAHLCIWHWLHTVLRYFLSSSMPVLSQLGHKFLKGKAYSPCGPFFPCGAGRCLKRRNTVNAWGLSGRKEICESTAIAPADSVKCLPMFSLTVAGGVWRKIDKHFICIQKDCFFQSLLLMAEKKNAGITHFCSIIQT